MAQPTAYNRQQSFFHIQARAPADAISGSALDSEFNAIKVTLDALRTNIALIQRDDGELANASVGLDQLSAEIEVGWEAPEVWVTATAYTVGNTVFHGSGFYRCLVAHTAGTFATDLAAADWELIVDLSALTIVDATQIANTPAGNIAATTVQAAIDELDSEKAATSHTHPSSALTDSTAAGRSMLAAASAAAQRTLLGLGALALEDTVPVTDIDAELALTGIIEPSALATDQNDWTPTGLTTASTIRMSASAAVNLTGMLAPATDGEIKILENVGTTYAITLSPSSASSAAANRFLIPKPIIVGPNSSVVLRYDLDATTPRWRLFDRAAHLPRGWIDGLITSNGSDATNDINIAAGECRGSRGILDLVLATALTGKQLDADWAAGSAAGGRYVSSANNPAIANTTYHLHLIGKADGTVDAIFYTGVDPTSILPSGYIDYRHLMSYVRATTLPAFTQRGDEITLKSPPLDQNQALVGTASTVLTLASVPTGIEMPVHMNIAAEHGSTAIAMYVRHPADTDSAPSISAAPLATIRGGASGATALARFTCFCNTSAQIAARSTTASSALGITILGYTHPRGRDS